MNETLERSVTSDAERGEGGPIADTVPSSPIREKPLREVLGAAAPVSSVTVEDKHSRLAGGFRTSVSTSTRTRSALSSRFEIDPAGSAYSARGGVETFGGTETTLAGVSVIVPCFNEAGCVAATATQIQEVLRKTGRPFEILFVNDGSTDATGETLAAIQGKKGIRVYHHTRNRGYGFSLKHGIEHAAHDLIAIIDADGTYPIARLGELIDGMDAADMVVGARVGKNVNVPLARRPAKWALRRLACYLAEYEIPDLNSGMRVMRRDVVRRFLGLLPDGFSFTTTITLAMLTHGYEVRYVPIDYARRIGRSSIRPIRDTLNFFALIVRTVLCFKPLRVFVPASAGLFATAVVVAVVSKLQLGQLADVTSVTLAMSAVQLLGIGLVADLINRRVPFPGG